MAKSAPETIRSAKFERVEKAVAKSTSFSEALTRLGVYNANGRNINTLRGYCSSKHIKTRHFSS